MSQKQIVIIGVIKASFESNYTQEYKSETEHVFNLHDSVVILPFWT